MDIEAELDRAIDAAEIEFEIGTSNDPQDSRVAYVTREQKIAGLIALLEDRLEASTTMTPLEAYWEFLEQLWESDMAEAQVDRAESMAEAARDQALMDAQERT